MTAYTSAELNTRLSEIADDPAWSGAFRAMAKEATAARADELGFTITPADLSDQAIHAALLAAAVDRMRRPAVPDDLDQMRAKLADLRAQLENGADQ
jgi:hypothetical protein